MVKVKGIPFELGGETFVIPPINLRDLQQLRDRLGEFSGDASPKSVALVIDATHAALRRNYPEITREQIGEVLDLGNMIEVMQAVMDVSGIRRKQLESGEGNAPSQTATSP